MATVCGASLALMSAEKDLKRHSLTLAGQAERSFQSVYLILSNVNDYLENQGVFDGQRVDESCFIWDRNGRLVAHGSQLAGIRLG